LIRSNLGHWKAYKEASFNPSQQDDRLSREWLEKNNHAYSLVGRGV
jgi:hypothetical protein